MRRRDFLRLACAGAAYGVLGGASAKAPAKKKKKKPNIVLILADDVGREAVGCYGGESYKTPEIDKLASRGMRLEHFYVAPVCHPTRVCLMSGRYPAAMGNPRWGSYPRKAEKRTVAHELKRAGYATAVAGKWQLTLLKKDPAQPGRMGFDEWCLFGWHEGPRFYSPYIWQNGKLRQGLEDAYGPEVYTEFLIDFMKRSGKRPFFAFYSMALCHAVSDDLKSPPPHGPNGRYKSFAEMVEEMDLRVGQIAGAVDKLGLADETLIIFTTDNGSPGSNIIRHEGRRLVKRKVSSKIGGREMRGHKGRLTDWGIRVPTVACWPGKIAHGSVADALIDLSDLLPTFTELAGLGAPAFEIDGRSFAGLLTGGKHTPREWVFSQAGKKACLRTRDWKLLPDGKLFDMSADPGETKAIRPGRDTDASKAARARLQPILAALVRGEKPPEQGKGR